MTLICSGMERSASTLTWQMSKKILGFSPEKTHVYVGGDDKVVYTYRHPIEAYYSLSRCFAQIYPVAVGNSYALQRLTAQHETYKRFVEDQKHGRHLLLLKYEDYYHFPCQRLLEIDRFLHSKSTLSCETSEKILEETSLQKNVWASRENGNFGDHNEETGLHGKHIDPVYQGVPGTLLGRYGELNDSGLIGLCEVFGYDPNANSSR
jgi:hypothetical protein